MMRVNVNKIDSHYPRDDYTTWSKTRGAFSADIDKGTVQMAELMAANDVTWPRLICVGLHFNNISIYLSAVGL